MQGKNIKYHVVIACPSCGSNSSVANVSVRQSRELAKYFDRVTLVSESFPQDLPKNVELGKVNPRKYNFLRRFCHVPNEYSFVRSVRKYLERLHADHKIGMIICHGHALATLAAKPLKEKYGIPFALVTHGDIFDRPKGTYDSRLTAFYKAVTPPAYRNADLIIALSPHMAECAIRGGAKTDTVHIVPNGIDPLDIGIDTKEVFAHINNKERNNFIKLLFTGRLSVEKGVDVLIRACEILFERGVRFELSIIGGGPLETNILNLVQKATLSDHVKFLDKVQRHSLGNYYRNADVLCVPSISEAQGIVVLEALVSGTPVIGSDVGGIPFMIKNGGNGILVPSQNPTALADAIETLYREPEKLAKLSKNAFLSVFPKFSWGHIGEKVSKLIAEVISKVERVNKTTSIKMNRV
jgi:glycosyltransferase involved in cell wall biosynthesis